MAQIKNNQVKFGVNPAFNTRTTTPQMRGTVDMQSAMRGVPGGTPFNMSYIPGPQSKIPAPKAPLVPGTNNYTPMSIQTLTRNAPQQNQPNISPSTPQNVQTSGPATNSTNSQLDSIRNQALGIQDLLNQKKASESAQTTNTNNTTFKGILDTLLGKSNPTREQERARKEMERISAGNKSIADEAKRVSDQYGAEIARVGGLGAGAVIGNKTTGSNVVGAGNANLAAMAAAATMDSLAKGQQAALEGTAQQLTGQEQAASAFKPSLEASLTQQQLGLSGVGTAAGLAAPLNIPYSAGGFDPVTGQQIAGGLGGYAGYKAAEQTFDLSGRYPDAGFQYNPNLTPAQNLQMMQAHQRGSPTYQRETYSQAGANNQQEAANITLGQQGYNQFGLQTEQLRQSVNIAESLGQNLASVMEQYSINGQPLKTVNIPFNALKKQYSPEMTAFQTSLLETANAYNQVFATTGTTPTDAQAISEAIFDEKSTPQQMIAALEQLAQQARKKVEISEQSTSGFYGLLPNQGGGGGGGGMGGGTGWGDILD
jgi:hypothetical protein